MHCDCFALGSADVFGFVVVGFVVLVGDDCLVWLALGLGCVDVCVWLLLIWLFLVGLAGCVLVGGYWWFGLGWFGVMLLVLMLVWWLLL